MGNDPLKARLIELGADAVCLSGSGPTFFAYFKNKAKAKKAFKVLRLEGKVCFLAKPLKKAIAFV